MGVMSHPWGNDGRCEKGNLIKPQSAQKTQRGREGVKEKLLQIKF
jgi:hypothetical protein